MDTLSAQIYTAVKEKSDSKFCIASKRPTTFWLKERENEVKNIIIQPSTVPKVSYIGPAHEEEHCMLCGRRRGGQSILEDRGKKTAADPVVIKTGGRKAARQQGDPAVFRCDAVSGGETVAEAENGKGHGSVSFLFLHLIGMPDALSMRWEPAKVYTAI